MYKIKNTRLISESRISIYTKYFIVPYISSISYIQETNSISLFVEMAQYANILFAPMTQLYSSSLETVESIPSDAINLDF